MEVTRIADGLRRWSTYYGEWRDEVGSVYVESDDWTISTEDGSRSCHFEHTVAISVGISGARGEDIVLIAISQAVVVSVGVVRVRPQLKLDRVFEAVPIAVSRCGHSFGRRLLGNRGQQDHGDGAVAALTPQ